MCIAVLGVRANSTVPPWTSGSVLAAYTLGWRLLLVWWAHEGVVGGSSAHRAVSGRGSDLVLRNLTHRAERPIRLLSSPLCLWLFHVVSFVRGLSHVVKPALGRSLQGVEVILVRPAQKISWGSLTRRTPLLNCAARLQA